MTQVSTSPGGGQKALTKWFVTPLKSRIELVPDASSPAAGVIVITRRDRGLAWTLFPTRKAYIERPLEEGELRELGKRLTGGLGIEDLGREKIRGYDCDKQRVRSEGKMDSRDLKGVHTVWRCDGFDVPLRIDGEDGSGTRTTALEVGPQPDHLFEIPTGYSKRESLRDVIGARREP